MNGLLAKHGYERMVSVRRAKTTARNRSGDDAVPTHFEIPVIDHVSLIDLDGPESILLIGRDDAFALRVFAGGINAASMPFPD